MLIRIDNEIINTDFLVHTFVKATLLDNNRRLDIKMYFEFENKSNAILSFQTVVLNVDMNLKNIAKEITENFFKQIEDGTRSFRLPAIAAPVIEAFSC